MAEAGNEANPFDDLPNESLVPADGGTAPPRRAARRRGCGTPETAGWARGGRTTSPPSPPARRWSASARFPSARCDARSSASTPPASWSGASGRACSAPNSCGGRPYARGDRRRGGGLSPTGPRARTTARRRSCSRGSRRGGGCPWNPSSRGRSGISSTTSTRRRRSRSSSCWRGTR